MLLNGKKSKSRFRKLKKQTTTVLALMLFAALVVILWLLLKSKFDQSPENVIHLSVPTNNSTIDSSDELTNVTFVWSLAKIIPKTVRFEIAYDVNFQNKVTYKDVLQGSELTVALERGQRYFWHILASQGDQTFSSETSTFSIIAKEKTRELTSDVAVKADSDSQSNVVSWIKPTDKDKDVIYQTPKPSVQLQWSPTPNVVSWELRYKKIVKEEKGQLSFTKPNANIELPTDGTWQFEVVGSDANGKFVAGSKQLTVNLVESSLLAAPYLIGWSSGKPVRESVTADHNGSVHLKWNPVCLAQSYDLNLVCNSNGADEKNFSSTATEYKVKGLTCSRYRIKLRARDTKDQPGPYSREYEIILKKQNFDYRELPEAPEPPPMEAAPPPALAPPPPPPPPPPPVEAPKEQNPDIAPPVIKKVIVR